jgi:hypothetical protein
MAAEGDDDGDWSDVAASVSDIPGTVDEVLSIWF